MIFNSCSDLFTTSARPVEKTREELDSIIESFLQETDRSKKAMGIVMKKLKENFAGQYDGKVASEILKNKLSGK
jgi:uncharacterized protein YqeY